MKQIELDKLAKLLHIIGPYPSTSVAHFSNRDIGFSRAVYGYCKEKNYDYQLNCTDHLFYEKATEVFGHDTDIRIINFSLDRPRYLIQGRAYEFLLVSVDIPAEQREDFLKKAHEILRNAGNILLFVPKMDNAERYEWERLLEKSYYVATNIIDDLFECYAVLISKKMHGWGDR